jgi:hypothetical protein
MVREQRGSGPRHHKQDILEMKRKLRAAPQELNPHRDKYPNGDDTIQKVKRFVHQQIDLGG